MAVPKIIHYCWFGAGEMPEKEKTCIGTWSRVTEETCAVHMCTNSWLSERERKRGNNKFWIEVVRPALRGLRSLDHFPV